MNKAYIYINNAWRQVSQLTIVNCWRKADILDNKNIDYSIDLNITQFIIIIIMF